MHTPDEVSEQIRKILARNMDGIDSFVFFIKGHKFECKAIMGAKGGLPGDTFFLTGFMISCLLSEIPIDMHERALNDIIKGHHEAFITGRGQLLPGWEIKPSKTSDAKPVPETDEKDEGGLNDILGLGNSD